MKLSGIEYTTQADLKLLRILVGKSGGNAKFGCPFCSASFPYHKKSQLYCLNDLLELHNKYVESGANPKKQQDFQNCVKISLIAAESDQIILGLLAVPELHLLIGVVDKFMTGIENNVFDTKAEGRKFMDSFQNMIFFSICKINICRKLL